MCMSATSKHHVDYDQARVDVDSHDAGHVGGDGSAEV